MAENLVSLITLVLILIGHVAANINDKKLENGCYINSYPDEVIDTAWLTIKPQFSKTANVSIWAVTEECYTCDLHFVAQLQTKNDNCTIQVDTRWVMKIKITVDDVVDDSCNVNQHFREGGNYSIILAETKEAIQCMSRLENSPADSNIPIYVALAVLVFLAMLWYILKVMARNNVFLKIRYYFNPAMAALDDHAQSMSIIKSKIDLGSPMKSKDARNNLRRRGKTKTDPVSSSKAEISQQDLGVPTNSTEADTHRPRKERLKSLDTFRGFSIVLMIFVNYGGGQYWFFKHSRWNGITVADLVFPWFVWIMGTSMAYSFQTQLRRSTPKYKMFFQIFKRSCILFVLGLLINSSDGMNPGRIENFRIPGVLQRFAGTYLIVATIHMFFAKPNDPNQYTWWSSIRDLTDFWLEWILNGSLVLIWLLLTFTLRVPNCPSGYLGPGGWAKDGQGSQIVSNCTGGAAAYIDHVIFGENHIYQTPTCQEIYKTTVPHDPEGLLGTLTSCFMCFLGLQAGKILRTFPDWKSRVKRFIIWGVILGVITAILCEGKKDGGFIPINKNLWSLSFVLCLSCFAFFMFAFCYVTIDVYNIWSGAPFYYPGMNAILLYMGHECVSQPLATFLNMQVRRRSHELCLPFNCFDTAIWILLSYFLFKHNIFLSV